MSASFGNNNNSQEVDLNITPIIDCFTVLITFLLASASFLSIGFFETYTPGMSADASQGEPDSEVVVKLKSNHLAEFKFKGKRTDSFTIQMGEAEGVKALDQKLDQLASSGLKINQVLLSADDQVDYQDLSLMMGHLNRIHLPVVVGEF